MLGFVPSLYPRSLRVLIALAAILPISLVCLIAASALQMIGVAYNIPQLVYGTELIARSSWILLGSAIAIAGGISVTSLISKALGASEWITRPKVKNSEVDARACEIASDTNVMPLLESLLRRERDLLRQRLAESRLVIRHDGALIAHEQAEMMRKIEEFILL